MYSFGPSNNLADSIFLASLIIIALSYFLYKRVKSNIPETNTDILNIYSKAPLFMTIYTIGVSLMKVSNGSVNKYPYTILITAPLNLKRNYNPSENYTDSEIDVDNLPSMSTIPDGDFKTPLGEIIMKIDLPVKSLVHVVGFSLIDDKFKMLLGNTNLESSLAKVQLEGSFPDYFRLYCTNGKEIELLELLDPTNMEFLINFCNSLNFELIDNTLYFVKSNSSQKLDDKLFIKSAVDFADRILPIILRMGIHK